MKIRITKAGWRRATPGDVVDVPDGVANMLIRRHRAEPTEDTNPADVRSAFARNAMAKETHEASSIPEGLRADESGGCGVAARKPVRKARLAPDR